MQVEEKVITTKYIIFGLLPWDFEDYTYTKILIKKINEAIKPVKKDQLRREEKNDINKFKVNMEFDFT